VVVEDAACAIGSEYRGGRVGVPHSVIACFSFHPRKILTTGEGGMITTADPHVADRLKQLRQHAMTISDVARHSSSKVMIECYDEVGYNYRMTDLQAAVGLVQLQRLKEMIPRRRQLAERYSSQLAALSWLVLPQESAECRHNFQSYMVRLKSDAPIGRDDLMQFLLDRGVSSRRGIMAIHREAPYARQECLVTDSAMVLPLYHDMKDDEQDYVIECVTHAVSA
jgi:dTDP-4-amino-4,6-dideoxygalactose transaminase